MKTFGKTRSLLLVFAVFVLFPISARAQSAAGNGAITSGMAGTSSTSGSANAPGSAAASTPASLPASPSAGYQRPTEKDRFESYVFDVIGPYAVVRAAAGAGISQATNAPPEWHGGARGFGLRIGSVWGQAAAEKTAKYALSSITREDPRFYRCDCSGFFPRFKHAILITVTSRRGEDGHTIFSVPKIVSPYVGGWSTLIWYPDRFGVKDAGRLGTYGLATTFGENIAREFIWAGL